MLESTILVVASDWGNGGEAHESLLRKGWKDSSLHHSSLNDNSSLLLPIYTDIEGI